MSGEFAHCLIVAAQNEGLLHDSHGAFTRVPQHMEAALDSAIGTALQGENNLPLPSTTTLTDWGEDPLPGAVRGNSLKAERVRQTCRYTNHCEGRSLETPPPPAQLGCVDAFPQRHHGFRED